MKNYYCEGKVEYIFTDEEGECTLTEIYELIFECKNKKDAKIAAKVKIAEMFDSEIGGDGITNVKIIIDDLYETSSDARF